MAKAKNLVETLYVTVSTTPQIMVYLEELVATGLFGKNRAEAAERLVAKGIDTLLKEGSLTRKSISKTTSFPKSKIQPQ